MERSETHGTNRAARLFGVKSIENVPDRPDRPIFSHAGNAMGDSERRAVIEYLKTL
jgi:hypothetical protein